MQAYKVHKGSLQERFLASSAKIQFYGGGFANGKTSAVCIKTLQIAKDYPGANILMARATYPKLNDTLKKEFLKWCPKNWIKSHNKADNVVILVNGTMINFRYVAQQGKSGEATTSNLLSANYDLIVLDQIEDPEITHKDFLDLIGRLRGMTKYIGTDSKMPASGPRWFLITANPTRNWVYHELIKPMHDLKAKRANPKLLIDDETGTPIIDVFEGSTYDNADNLEPDYIRTMELTYRGQMRERFLLGKWGAYEGLIYANYDETVHTIPHEFMQNTILRMVGSGVKLGVVEGYDYGMAVESCYILGFVDQFGNVMIVDGFYKPEYRHDDQVAKIKEIRREWGVSERANIYADPSIFRRGPGSRTLVGVSTAGMFLEDGINMIRGNNDIINGIIKVKSYLEPIAAHTNPFYGSSPAPRLYFSDKLEFVSEEMGAYSWKKDSSGSNEDVPNDKKDHLCDTLKYALSDSPELGRVIVPLGRRPVGLTVWGEMDVAEHKKRKARHGGR